MDTDVVLNSVLDTYRQTEIRKIEDARKDLLENKVAKFFVNGRKIGHVKEFTVNQHRQFTPIYEIGHSGPVQHIPGRVQEATGIIQLDGVSREDRQIVNPPSFSTEPVFCEISAEQIYQSGKIMRIRISDMRVSEVPDSMNVGRDRMSLEYSGTFTYELGDTWI